MSVSNPPKAILTDVFGTIVNWRATVTDHLAAKSRRPSHSASANTRELAASTVDWSQFAQAWRHSYHLFTATYDSNPDTPFKTVDQHHRSSLDVLLAQRHLSDLWTSEQKDEIALIWHFLDPWPDSASGLRRLRQKFTTCTLSNGNQALLHDLAQHGSLSYSGFFSGEDFGAYKPSPLLYGGAAERLGLKTGQCALLAAHLGDLEAARRCGYQTIYVERRAEESWNEEDVNKARWDGWVDMWIDVEQGGLQDVARRFGIE